MANEATITVSMSYAKGFTQALVMSKGSYQRDVAGNQSMAHVQAIGNGAREALVLGEVTPTGGLLYVENLDATNDITIYSDASSGAAMDLLKPGDAHLFRCPVSAPAAQASGGTPLLRYLILPA